MKQYKNICWAFGFYVTTIMLVVVIPMVIWLSSPDFASSPSLFGHLLLLAGIISILIGIFFGFRSIKAKESAWAGHLMVLIGGLMLAFPVIASIIGYNL